MHRTLNTIVILIVMLATLSCSVISPDVKKDAAPPVRFETLVRQSGQYMGKTVILGGHILKTENLPDKTVLFVLQTPLHFMDEPGGRDNSRGRFAVIHDGFLDPEIYRAKRKITAAGTLTGTLVKEIDKHSYKYLAIKGREIYLWPKQTGYSQVPYYYYPYYRHRHYGHPYYWDPFYRHRHPW